MGIEGLITADGYDEAFVGLADRFGKQPVAVYSYEMCIQILMRDHEMSHEEALEMLKARDAQWEGKLAKADSLIESQKVVISDGEKLIAELEEYAKVEEVLSEAKSKQIQLLQARDKTNEELIKTLQPKWYENQYLWLGIGFILGKI